MKQLTRGVGILCLCMVMFAQAFCFQDFSNLSSVVYANQNINLSDDTENPEVKVLMIGNSYTRWGSNKYSIPHIVETMAKKNGKNIDVDYLVHGASYLSYYAFWSPDYHKYHEELMGRLQKNQYDYIVLQEQTRSSIEKYEDEFRPAIRQICTYVNTYQKKAKVLLYEIPAYDNGTKTIVNGKSQILLIKEFQERILYGHTRLSQEFSLEMLPVGVGIYHASQLYPDISMISSDLLHPSHAGYFIAASYLYHGITGEIPQIKAADVTDCNLTDAQITALGQVVNHKVILNKSELSLGVGFNETLSAQITAGIGYGGTLFWESLNPEIAIVDENTGKVTGIAEGTTGIVAQTTTGLMAVCCVTVENTASPEMGFGQKNYQAMVGDNICLLPELKNWIFGDDLKWSIGNKTVAGISANGIVSAKKMGRTLVRARSSMNKNLTATYYLFIKGQAPIGLTAKVTKITETGGKIQLNWNPVDGAKQYKIYRYDAESSVWSVIGTSHTTVYEDATITVNKNYDYKVTATAGYELTETDFSNTVTGRILGTCTPQTGSIQKKYVKLVWEQNPMAKGYVIYRSNKKYGGYQVVKTITRSSRTYYKDTSITKGKTYYYRIKTYQMESDGTKIYSAYSARLKVKTLKDTKKSKKTKTVKAAKKDEKTKTVKAAKKNEKTKT